MRSPNGRVARDMMRSALELQRVVDEKGQVFEAASITSGALLLPLDTVTALVPPAQEQAIASGVALQGLGKSLAGMSGALSAIPVIGKVVQTFVKKTARRTLEPAGEKLRNNGIRIGKLEKNLEKTGSKVSMIDGLFLASAGVLVSVAAFFYSAGDILVKAHMCAFELGEEQVVAELEATMEAMRNGSQVLIRHLNNIPSNVTNPFGDLKLRLDILSVKLPNLLSEFTKINLALQPFMWLTKFMEFRMCFRFFIFFEECFTVGEMLNFLGKLLGVLSFLVNPIADLFAGLFPDISLPLPSLLDSWLLDLDKIMLDIDIAYNTLLPAMQFPFDFTDLMLPDILAKLPDNLPCNPFDDDAEIEAEESLEDDEDETDGEGRRLAGRRWTRRQLKLPVRTVRRVRNRIRDNLPRQRAAFAIPMTRGRAWQRGRSLTGRSLFRVNLVQNRPEQQATQRNRVSKRKNLRVEILNERPRIALMNPAADRADRYAFHVNIGNTVAEVFKGTSSRKDTIRLPMHKLFHLEVFFVRRANKKTGKDLAPSPFVCIVDFDKTGAPSRSGELSLEMDGGRNYYSDPDFVFVPHALLALKETKYHELSTGDRRKYHALCPPRSRCVQNPYADVLVKDRSQAKGELSSAVPFRKLEETCKEVCDKYAGSAKNELFRGELNQMTSKLAHVSYSRYLSHVEGLEKHLAIFNDVFQTGRQDTAKVSAIHVYEAFDTHFKAYFPGEELSMEIDDILNLAIAKGGGLEMDDFDIPEFWGDDEDGEFASPVLGEFANFAIYQLFPPAEERKKYFKWETYGLCALKNVYKELFVNPIMAEEVDQVAFVKVLQLLCEDGFARTLKVEKEGYKIPFWNRKNERVEWKLLEGLPKTTYTNFEKHANKLARDRFGAFLNGFPEHQVKSMVFLPFPQGSKDLEEILKRVPVCEDVIGEESRVYYVSSTECSASCNKGLVTTRLCAGKQNLPKGTSIRWDQSMDPNEANCILIHCYTPEDNGSSSYVKGKKYWKKAVGKVPSGLHGANKGGANDRVVTLPTQIYHVEHMVDHSEEGRNAFSNFVMTWGLPNLQLKNADKGLYKLDKSVETQWQNIYGALLEKAEEVQSWCDVYVTADSLEFSLADGQDKDGDFVLDEEKEVVVRIIPRTEKMEDVVGDKGESLRVSELNYEFVFGMLYKGEGEGLKELKSLMEEACSDDILSKNYKPSSGM